MTTDSEQAPASNANRRDWRRNPFLKPAHLDWDKDESPLMFGAFGLIRAARRRYCTQNSVEPMGMGGRPLGQTSRVLLLKWVQGEGEDTLDDLVTEYLSNKLFEYKQNIDKGRNRFLAERELKLAKNIVLTLHGLLEGEIHPYAGPVWIDYNSSIKTAAQSLVRKTLLKHG